MSDSVVRPSEHYFKLSQETARISWSELARFFAQGRVLGVAQGLDLPAVAAAIAEDDAAKVRAWKDAGQLKPVPDEQARDWFAQDVDVWAVTIAPYVLVQPVTT